MKEGLKAKSTKDTIEVSTACDCDDGECGNRHRLAGMWVKPRTDKKDEQVLEIRFCYRGKDEEACRDYISLLTYGGIIKDKEGAIEHGRRVTGSRPKLVERIIEWFIETVDKNWAPKRKELVQYLAEYLEAESTRYGGRMRWFTRELSPARLVNYYEVYEDVVADGIKAYERAENCQVAIIDKPKEKGITNEEEERAKAKT